MAKRRSSATSDGFTLLELILVLVLMGLVAGLATPFVMSTVERIQLNTATRKMAAALRYARNEAVTHKKRYLFSVDIDANRYSLSRGDDEEQTLERTVEGDARVAAYENESDPVSSGVFSIQFFPQGSASGGKIRIEPVEREESDSYYVITIDPVTGASRIEQKKNPEAGFSLLEVVVSMAILAIGFVTVMELFSGSVKSASLSEQYLKASTLAHSKFNEMELSNFQLNETSGYFEDPYRWEVEISPYESELNDPDNQINLYQILLTVLWNDAGKEKNVQLAALTLAGESYPRPDSDLSELFAGGAGSIAAGGAEAPAETPDAGDGDSSSGANISGSSTGGFHISGSGSSIPSGSVGKIIIGAT